MIQAEDVQLKKGLVRVVRLDRHSDRRLRYPFGRNYCFVIFVRRIIITTSGIANIVTLPPPDARQPFCSAISSSTETARGIL